MTETSEWVLVALRRHQDTAWLPSAFRSVLLSMGSILWQTSHPSSKIAAGCLRHRSPREKDVPPNRPSKSRSTESHCMEGRVPTARGCPRPDPPNPWTDTGLQRCDSGLWDSPECLAGPGNSRSLAVEEEAKEMEGEGITEEGLA